ncbi:MAG: sigma-54-dependent Fis family transcriptional regulator [Bacteroidetes bacterium]|nr:MAG: sigma-54-dependent Fis family transcriptional regulator [Bacteroidota bacterium]
MVDIQSIKLRFGIIGNSPLINHAVHVAVQVAPTDMTVLITGESGSGKESFSKIIHQLSNRKHNGFIAINCGAIPEGTIDSELFGHEKGSFTGASEARKGYFEEHNGGTIFLDEIGEMPMGTQARLLRVLENGEFIRVGSSKVQKTNVRVVAATNVNLLRAVQKNSFREDLYYRLSTVPIMIPPLRERGADVDLLFRKFAADSAEKYHIKSLVLDEEAKKLLLKYRFPGNIRQLKNIVENMSVLSESRLISMDNLASYLPSNELNYLPALIENQSNKESNPDQLLYKFMLEIRNEVNELRKLVISLLQRENGNSPLVPESEQLFRSFEENLFRKPVENQVISSPSLLLNSSEKEKDVEYDKAEDVTDKTEDDNFSLEKQEREMIVKALKKSNGRRKYAAQNLGISERTLYRKIKQYEIDEKNEI